MTHWKLVRSYFEKKVSSLTGPIMTNSTEFLDIKIVKKHWRKPPLQAKFEVFVLFQYYTNTRPGISDILKCEVPTA